MQYTPLYFRTIHNSLVAYLFRAIQHSFISQFIHYIYIYIYIYIYFIPVRYHTNSLRLFSSFNNRHYILLYFCITPYISHINFTLLYLISFVSQNDINPLTPITRVASSYPYLVNYRYHPFSLLNPLLYIIH